MCDWTIQGLVRLAAMITLFFPFLTFEQCSTGSICCGVGIYRPAATLTGAHIAGELYDRPAHSLSLPWANPAMLVITGLLSLAGVTTSRPRLRLLAAVAEPILVMVCVFGNGFTLVVEAGSIEAVHPAGIAYGACLIFLLVHSLFMLDRLRRAPHSGAPGFPAALGIIGLTVGTYAVAVLSCGPHPWA